MSKFILSSNMGKILKQITPYVLIDHLHLIRNVISSKAGYKGLK